MYSWIPFPSCQADPVIEISSTPSSNTLPIGASLNLTCTAKQNDDFPKKSRSNYIQWFGPHGFRQSCVAELAAPIMRCTLVVGSLTLGKFGSYTCKVSTDGGSCIIKNIKVNLRGKHLTINNIYIAYIYWIINWIMRSAIT